MSGFVCGSERRRRLVREAAATRPINGIDHLEVDPDDQRILHVHFLAEHGLAGLEPGNVAIDGGERIAGLVVDDVDVVGDTATVTASASGDFSTYVLRLRTSLTDDAVPAPFDPRLASVAFSFKVGCPDPFDCAEDHECPPEPIELPDLDYLAKDYDSFRRLMLDRMAVTAPQWTERNPADQLVTLVELLAAVADEQSYTQDAIATEAYLRTARLRRSVRRHARLLGYAAHDGCNARAFVQLTADRAGPPGGVEVAAGTPVFTGDPRPVATADPPPADAVVFRTLHAVTVRPRHERLELHPWHEDECCLPAGATAATLLATIDDDTPVHLEVGDLLLLQETADPGTGDPAGFHPARRQVVRLSSVEPGTDPLADTPSLAVTWHEDDALMQPLCVTTRIGGVAVTIGTAAAGIVVAEHARELAGRAPVPGTTPDGGLSGLARPYRPRLPDAPLTFRHDYVPADPAAAQLLRDPATARADLTVHIAGRDWVPPPGRDLLNSGPQDRHVAVETEVDGAAWLRFGDGHHGERPPVGRLATADYAVGNGVAGNVGRDALRRILLPGRADDLTAVTNPLPAAGGVDPETIEQIRIAAPEAFRVQQRAVTADDYEDVLLRHRQVQRAHATLRWTGSWYTVFVAVDLLGGRPVDADTEAELRRHLDRYRMAGHDLEITGPQFVPLDLHLQVCAKPGFERRQVEAQLLTRLSSRRLADGSLGLFHPDRFSFGDPVHLSEVYAAALEVAGVDWLVATRLRRRGRPPAGELEAEVLQPAPQEIIRLANDPSFPERGQLEIDVRGGR